MPYSFLLQLDVELTADIPVEKLNSIGVRFLFEFVWLKSLVTKQKLRTKFLTSIVKLRNMILLRMFYSFLRNDSWSKKHVKGYVILTW